ncbi:MAG: ribonuclease R family protein [Campylobacterota bacterium]|nr:ribonuclease R family protein [Campylobacterota bacterium]
MTKRYLENLSNHTNYVKIENGEYKLNSRYKIGKIDIKNGISILKLEKSSQKIYIEFDNLNGAYNDDIVLCKIIFNPKGKTKAKVVEILEASNKNILCYIKNKKLYTIKDNIVLKDNLKDKTKIKDGDIVIFDFDKILKNLGNIEDPKVDEIISLYLYNESFRQDPFETNNIFKSYDYEKRVDLRELDFCTIDPIGAKDFDDAIYYDDEKCELYVAIADVSSYVYENSKIDEEAKRRSFSIYLPHKVLPMLPFELSNNLCSLVPNKDRLAYVFKLKLDIKNCKVLDSTLFEATINSKRRYSYDEIDTILEEKNENKHKILYAITDKFRAKRLKNGYDFRNDEIKINLDENQNFKDTTIEHTSPSHSLVEECMLLANQEAAKKLSSIGIFRVHDEPTQAKIAKLIEDVNQLGLKVKLKENIHNTILSIQDKAEYRGLENEVDQLIIQSQQQARYSNIKHEHFGLGFKDYSHFTSPIRRYADLILHRILKTKKIPKDIEEICTNISQQERTIAELVWDFEDRKYTRAANKNIGNIFEAKIVDTEKQLVKLTKELVGARVKLENYSGEKLFRNLNIEIIDCDILSKKIIGRIV